VYKEEANKIRVGVSKNKKKKVFSLQEVPQQVRVIQEGEHLEVRKLLQSAQWVFG
jgi:hypothetical protein